MSDLATLPAKKLHEVIARRNARWDQMLDATLAAGLGDYRHSDMVVLAKGSSLSDKANLARDYLNARHDWKVAKDELDARMDFHGSDKPIRRVAPGQCTTCDGRGEIGGFVNTESGYQTDPCPDCALATPQIETGVA